MSVNIDASFSCCRPRTMPSSEKPRMDCSGVRSSWLMLAMNSVLAREASSATSRASRVARSAARNSLTSISTRQDAGRPAVVAGHRHLDQHDVAARAVAMHHAGLVADAPAAGQQLAVARVVHRRLLGRQVARRGLADDVLAAAAGEVFPGLVDAQVAAQRVEHRQRQRADLQHQRRDGELRLQLLLRDDAVGHVGGAAGEADDAVLAHQRHHGHVEVPRAVRALARHGGLRMAHRQPRVGGEQRTHRVALLGQHQLVQLRGRAPACAVSPPMAHPALVDEGDGAARVGAEDQVLHALDRHAQLAFAQRHLGLRRSSSCGSPRARAGCARR